MTLVHSTTWVIVSDEVQVMKQKKDADISTQLPDAMFESRYTKNHLLRISKGVMVDYRTPT